MKRMMILAVGIALCLTAVTRADDVVYKGTTGLVIYLKRNVRLADTLTVGSAQYLHYYAKEGEVQVPLTDVVEIRFKPYDLADPSITAAYADTLAVPVPSPTPLTAIKSVTVSSIAALKTYLADNTVDEIVVTNGKYSIATASSMAATSLWIGAAFAGRTRPITVRAQTRGGVTFDGGGATYFGGITFNSGVHDQTWDGFNFVNGTPTFTGVIVIGEYPNNATFAIAPHHITLRHISIFNCSGVSKTGTSTATDHAIYVSESVGGPHDFLLEEFTVDDRTNLGLSTAICFYHSQTTPSSYNAWNFTIRNFTVRGTQQAFMLWDPTLKNISISDVTVKNALKFGMVYQTVGSTGIVVRNFVSTGSGERGFYSDQGTSPAGVTFISCSFN